MCNRFCNDMLNNLKLCPIYVYLVSVHFQWNIHFNNTVKKKYSDGHLSNTKLSALALSYKTEDPWHWKWTLCAYYKKYKACSLLFTTMHWKYMYNTGNTICGKSSWLFDSVLLNIPLKNISLIRRHHHWWWSTAKCWPMLGN